jgi:hypothetical protein
VVMRSKSTAGADMLAGLLARSEAIWTPPSVS